MLILGLSAGHYKNTPGRRTTFSPKGVKEWEMNNEVCNHIETILNEYKNVKVYRLDDRSGLNYFSIDKRLKRAKELGCNLILDIHHNGGGGTGVEIYQQYKDKTNLAKLIIGEVAKNTKLKNRGVKFKQYPGRKYTDYFGMLRKAHCQSMLVEGGFMDCASDCKIITSQKGQIAYAKGLTNAVTKYFNLVKKSVTPQIKADEYYFIQLGAYKTMQDAEKHAKKYAKTLKQDVGIKFGDKKVLKWIKAVKQ